MSKSRVILKTYGYPGSYLPRLNYLRFSVGDMGEVVFGFLADFKVPVVNRVLVKRFSLIFETEEEIPFQVAI